MSNFIVLKYVIKYNFSNVRKKSCHLNEGYIFKKKQKQKNVQIPTA